MISPAPAVILLAKVVALLVITEAIALPATAWALEARLDACAAQATASSESITIRTD
jgi:hypothetical protein